MLSDADEKAILAQEELIAKVLKIRASEHPRRFWEKAGVVPAATAILTVLVTSVAGYYSQKALRDNENRIATVHDNMQLARDAAKHANRAVAAVLKLNEERALAITGAFASLDSVRVTAITDSANRLQEDWRVQREDIEMELFLVFDTSTVLRKWRNTRSALDSQITCVERMYERVRTLKRYAAPPVCREKAAASVASVADLRQSISRGLGSLRQ